MTRKTNKILTIAGLIIPAICIPLFLWIGDDRSVFSYFLFALSVFSFFFCFGLYGIFAYLATIIIFHSKPSIHQHPEPDSRANVNKHGHLKWGERQMSQVRSIYRFLGIYVDLEDTK